jgi:ParB-like chromosome segregation protein Spo0J
LHDDAHVAQIAASIREWGWTIPVLIDEDENILAGHGRVLAARKLNLETVPVLVARGWSDAKKRAYILADNKLALNAKWDRALLASELSELRDCFETDLIGFSEEELARILADASSPEDFQTYDENITTEHACPQCGFRW